MFVSTLCEKYSAVTHKNNYSYKYLHTHTHKRGSQQTPDAALAILSRMEFAIHKATSNASKEPFIHTHLIRCLFFLFFLFSFIFLFTIYSFMIAAYLLFRNFHVFLSCPSAFCSLMRRSVHIKMISGVHILCTYIFVCAYECVRVWLKLKVN